MRTSAVSLCSVTLLLLVLLSVLLAGCSGQSGLAPGAGTPDRAISDHPVVTVLPDTYVAGGQAASIVATERPGDGELLLDVTVSGAKVLKAIFFHLEFDPAKYSVGKLDSRHLLGSEDQLISILLSDPVHGNAEYGEMLVLPQEADANGKAKGFTGDGLLCTLHLKLNSAGSKPALSGRGASEAPGSDGAKAELSYDGDTQSISWQHFSPGDYNQDGTVAVSDLTPIGIHFGADVPAGSDPDGRDSSSIEDVVDGSNDGKVNVSDLTAIGLNFQNKSSAYNIYKGDPGDLPASNRGANGAGAELVESVDFAGRQGNAGSERVHFQRPLASPDPAKTYWVRPADGSALGTPSSTITPAKANARPVATLYGDSHGFAVPPNTIKFDASESFDSDGSIALYEMDFEGDGVYELSSAILPTLEYTYNVVGFYEPELRVTDDEGAMDSATWYVAVPQAGNAAPSASFTKDSDGGELPVSINFDASGSTDFDGSITLYQWDWDNDGQYDEEHSDTPLASHVFESAGVTGVSLRVVDDKGSAATTVSALALTDSDNLAPIASMNTDLGSGPRPLKVSFDASASLDTDGSVASYHWDFGGDGSVDLVTEAPKASFTYNLVTTFHPTVYVLDDDGAQSNVLSKDVEVTAGWVNSQQGSVDGPVSSTRTVLVTDDQPFTYPFTVFGSYQGRLDSVYWDNSSSVMFSGSTVALDAFSDFDLMVVTGRPAVAFNHQGTAPTGGVYYTRAADPLGNWDDPVPVDPSGAAVAGGGISMEVVGAKPAVVYAGNESDLNYCQASTLSGSAWNAPVPVASGYSRFPALISTGFSDEPLIFNLYDTDTLFPSTQPFRFTAMDTNGAAWDSASLVVDQYSGQGLAVAVINNLPALVYRDESGAIVFHQANNAVATIWRDPVVIYKRHNSQLGSVALAQIAGVPAVAFKDEVADELIYVQAENANGTVWLEPEVVDNRDSPGNGCSLVEFNQAPYIAYGCESLDIVRIAFLPGLE